MSNEKENGSGASNPAGYERPAFLDDVAEAYTDKGKGVVVLSGNVADLFWCNRLKQFVSLERALFHQYSDKFIVLRVDAAAGIDDYNSDDLTALRMLCKKADAAHPQDSPKRLGDLDTNIANNRHSPLATLQLLSRLLELVYKTREMETEKSGKPTTKKVCAVVQFAGAFFPAGDFDRLSENNVQKLVTFLNLVMSPWFQGSNDLIILVSDAKSQVNARITGLPSVECVEIGYPQAVEREMFTGSFVPAPGSSAASIQFEQGLDRFVAETSGLPLTALQEILKAAGRTSKPVSRKDVIDQLAAVVKAQLDGVARLKHIEHCVDDVVGYENVGEIWRHTFKRCNDRATAVPVVIVSGPNGGGKTFQAEAYARESGRLVLVLTGLRSKWFGETDAVFEKLSLLLRSLGNVLIIVDEAHTKFGSVHKDNVHETERRLAGSLIELMGDPTMYGKVVWLLATSRPDQLDPDILSRSPVQIPIFDLEGDDRRNFVKALFARKKIKILDAELGPVVAKTASYSNRDLAFLAAEVLSRGHDCSVLATLAVWQATTAIRAKRTAQEIVAVQTCSYPGLLPPRLRTRVGQVGFEQELLSARLVLAD